MTATAITFLVCHGQSVAATLMLQSFDFSSGLFSFGLTVERTTMNLFSMSNQKGAPREIARAVSNQPRKLILNCTAQPVQKPPSQKCNPGHLVRGSSGSSKPIGSPNAWSLHWLFFSLHCGDSG